MMRTRSSNRRDVGPTRYDAIVVGCGPAGAVAGRELARRGHSVLILEEHHEIGRPIQCAGLVTRRVFGTVPCDDVVLNSLSGAELIAPGGRGITLDGGKERAVVIDRAKFDKRAASMAIDAGCRISLGTKVVGLTFPAGKKGKNGDAVVVRTRGKAGAGELFARIIIGADGVQSSVGRLAGLRPPEEILPAFEAELSGITAPANVVRIFIGRDIAPGFFGWLIPSGGNNALAGLCCEPGTETVRHRFQKLMKQPALLRYAGGGKVTRYFSGSVPLTLARKTFGDRVVLTGDAAGQVKPVSGGGLFTGTTCAVSCAETVSAALSEDDLSSRSLSRYEKRWKGQLGNEFSTGRRLRKAFKNVSDSQMDEIVKMLDRPELLDLIRARGDLDSPSKLAKLLFRKAPGLLKFSGPLVKSFFQ